MKIKGATKWIAKSRLRVKPVNTPKRPSFTDILSLTVAQTTRAVRTKILALHMRKEKQKEVEKMDKQKQIEEMAEELRRIDLSYFGTNYHLTARKLLEKYQPKIPENAVVLTKEQNEKWLDWLNLNMAKARKETAEKFAKMLKAGLNEFWEDYEDNDGKVDKGVFILDVLGVESMDGEVITEGLIDEICKEIAEGKA